MFSVSPESPVIVFVNLENSSQFKKGIDFFLNSKMNAIIKFKPFQYTLQSGMFAVS